MKPLAFRSAIQTEPKKKSSLYSDSMSSLRFTWQAQGLVMLSFGESSSGTSMRQANSNSIGHSKFFSTGKLCPKYIIGMWVGHQCQKEQIQKATFLLLQVITSIYPKVLKWVLRIIIYITLFSIWNYFQFLSCNSTTTLRRMSGWKIVTCWRTCYEIHTGQCKGKSSLPAKQGFEPSHSLVQQFIAPQGLKWN